MTYSYDYEKMAVLLKQFLTRNLTATSNEWLEKQYKRYKDTHKQAFFNLTFTAIPRFINKVEITISPGEQQALREMRTALDLSGWHSDRLARSWWLLQLPAEDEAVYVERVIALFRAAEMNEQVALYGSLPLLAYPEAFVKQASEGVRTNMKNVFDAIVLNNPYPSEYMEEAAWNQLVLKSFFMDRPVNQIIGLDKRTNRGLAHILSDYAHERWAAGRPVNPILWRPVAPFIDAGIFPDIQKLFQSEDRKEKQAAALACYYSTYEPAKEVLKKYEELENQIVGKQLTWESLEYE